MMNYFQEITIIKHQEITNYFIWSKLYKQLHIALADIKNNHEICSIGVSFPNYFFEEKEGKTYSGLGDKLRVFAKSKEDLEKLNLNQWLERLLDYVHIKSIKPIENPKGYLVVQRYHYKDPIKQAKRFAEFKGISFEDALAHCKKHKSPAKPYPFIQLTSEENAINYRLNIMQKDAESAVEGEFNTYGINNLSSDEVTVPHW